MYTDPQVVTVATVANSLAAISRGENQSVYRSADETLTLQISHSYGKRRRRLVRMDHKKTAADPLSAQTAEVSAGFQFVIDEPTFGYTDSELRDLVAGLTTWLSSANVLKLAAGES